MNLPEIAFHNVFPERIEKRKFSLSYSGKFSSYNANVKYSVTEIKFSLSKEFEELSDEIKLGMMEHLFCKMYKTKVPTANQDLYRSFMKHLTKVARIEEKDSFLLERFENINKQYFFGMMSAPNLRWGQKAFRKLGHYEYASDTIVISSVFADAPSDEKIAALLDFVLYHEMLHKKHQYDHKKERAIHHSRTFRLDEKKWHDKDVNKRISWFLAKKRLRKALLDW
jgi:hypothetical protein